MFYQLRLWLTWRPSAHFIGHLYDAFLSLNTTKRTRSAFGATLMDRYAVRLIIGIKRARVSPWSDGGDRHTQDTPLLQMPCLAGDWFAAAAACEVQIQPCRSSLAHLGRPAGCKRASAVLHDRVTGNYEVASDTLLLGLLLQHLPGL